jgi:hypothetical protein
MQIVTGLAVLLLAQPPKRKRLFNIFLGPAIGIGPKPLLINPPIWPAQTPNGRVVLIVKAYPARYVEPE